MKVGVICVRDTVMVKKSETLTEAAKLMKELHVGALVVVEAFGEKNRPLGIITDRDIVLKAVAEEKSCDITVGELVSAELVTANENDMLFDTLEHMKSKGIRRVPVIDDEGDLAGILSTDDIVEFLTDEMKDISTLFCKEVQNEQKA
jgi:CBS domain-containing protein